MTKPRALDLFCGAGGAAMGLHRAGFDVTGVDIAPQRHFPFRFVQADALTYPLAGFDLIWASPPCQRYSSGNRGRDVTGYPDLIEPIRRRLRDSGTSYILENVMGAPLVGAVMLCGLSFGLGVFRHRLFESDLELRPPVHWTHNGQVKLGHYCTVTGGARWRHERVARWRVAMGIDWMSKRELTQAIPPAYSEWLGRQALGQLRAPAVAL